MPSRVPEISSRRNVCSPNYVLEPTDRRPIADIQNVVGRKTPQIPVKYVRTLVVLRIRQTRAKESAVEEANVEFLTAGQKIY